MTYKYETIYYIALGNHLSGSGPEYTTQIKILQGAPACSMENTVYSDCLAYSLFLVSDVEGLMATFRFRTVFQGAEKNHINQPLKYHIFSERFVTYGSESISL
ncbi:hypothetical protein ACO03_20775 (plasmid) [Pantoea ananatis]|nr:hypothetical protein ACO03_20775 [Pantoea ananatis]